MSEGRLGRGHARPFQMHYPGDKRSTGLLLTCRSYVEVANATLTVIRLTLSSLTPQHLKTQTPSFFC